MPDDRIPGDHHATTVFISDSSEARTLLVEEIAARCDARLAGIPAGAERLPERRDSVALFGLSADPPAGGAGLEAVRSASRAGAAVLAYGDGSSSWPVGTRCQVLLAGAQHLLDSSASDFAVALKSRLRLLLESLRRGQDEVEQTRALMKAQGLIGCSPAMLDVFRLTLKVARLSDFPALVTGESGTGKELLARALHALDPKRCRGPFVPLNCAALTRGLAESELFGHRRGAFTGADRDRRGLVRAADGGVLFLDEIAELDLDVQGKLLRVVQENRVLALGQDHEVEVSVRVIGATHRDLDERVQGGTFREDLFHRMNVLRMHVPPLRDRAEDLPALVEHFLEKHRPLRPNLHLSAGREFIEALGSVPLPGNARQLENLVRHALARKEEDSPLDLGDLPREVWQQLSANAATGPAPETSSRPGAAAGPTDPVAILDSNGWKLARSLAHVERLFLRAALDRTRGNQSHTARLLGITPRSVYTKLRKYQLSR